MCCNRERPGSRCSYCTVYLDCNNVVLKVIMNFPVISNEGSQCLMSLFRGECSVTLCTLYGADVQFCCCTQ